MSRKTRLTLGKAIKASENPSIINEERVTELNAVIERSKKKIRVDESATSEGGVEEEARGSTPVEGNRRDAPPLMATLKQMTRGSARAASESVPETESDLDVASSSTTVSATSASQVGRAIDRWTDMSKRGNDQAHALYEKHNNLSKRNADLVQQDGMLVQLIIEKQREDVQFQRKMIEELKASFGSIAAGVDFKEQLAVVNGKVAELDDQFESFKTQIMQLRVIQDEHSKRLDG